MSIEVTFSKERGLATAYGQAMVFHCNHYNRSLQQTIEDPGYIDSERILVDAAKETVFLQLRECFARGGFADVQAKLNFAAEIFQCAGFGRVDFSGVRSPKGGTVVVPSSHYGMAVKLNLAHRTKPAEYFDRGFIQGALAAAFETSFAAEQTSSISLGDDRCEYVVTAAGDLSWAESLVPRPLPALAPIPARSLDSPIDEDKIVTALAGMSIVGDERGLIPAFGVYLTRMYADYYNKISFRFEDALAKEMGGVELATDLLVEAGHICGFNTMGGIMESDEWKGLVLPMVRCTEDWLHGIIACINALGWGIWRIQEIAPNKRMTVRVYEGYESLGHLRWFGKADHPIDYLATGVASALMNLVYLGDIASEPRLDKDFYFKLFKDADCFNGKQTKCLAAGDDYSEIVITR